MMAVQLGTITKGEAMKPEFIPNETAVAETAEHMLATRHGAKPPIEDVMWWANAHAFSYDRGSNGQKFWLAVHAYLAAKNNQRRLT